MDCHHLQIETRILNFEIEKQDRISGFHPLHELPTQNSRAKTTLEFNWMICEIF